MVTRTEEIKRSLILKIRVGQYPVGTMLPSCRDLAEKLGINRNTASKVYQELAQEGLVKAVRGQGVVVIKRDGAEASAVPLVRDHLLAAAREAKLLGMEHDRFLSLATDVADKLYQPQKPSIAFIECNEQDTRSLARELHAELSCPVQPLLLNDVEDAPGVVAQDYDLICTTLYHLATVTRLFSMAQEKVYSVHAPSDPDALLELARLDPNTRLGIICEKLTTNQQLAGAVSAIHTGEVRSCLVTDHEAVRDIGRSVDLVIDVPSCHKAVERLLPTIPILTVGFRLDNKSLAPLRERVGELLSVN